ncbi:phage tail tape measure protein [Psychrobacter glaciei]|uniref:phage tail tape measure protein n=1 Tax=Psychrobacter glaciei TaxID=619771 RepID=UPI001F05BD3A|nr:phage tail tape measure protein [Psychrobacter glaciei]MCH1781733.1 phage tail tape measure protein [Psychrobacter glaciei]
MASVLSRIQVIMEANTANYNNELNKARKKSKTTFSDISTSAGKMALGVGVALAGMGALSIKTAMSFETSMAEIDKTVEFTTSNGLANMRKELQALTTQIPQTFEELAAVTATGGQLGIAERDLVHFTEVMAKMGVAFDLPAQQVADSMAKIANVFQIPIANIDRLGDAINTLSNNTPATAAQLIDSLLRVGGVAKVYGLSEDATLGLTGALIAMGKPAEVASTAVNSLLTSFSTLDYATKSQLIGFEQLGLNIDDFSKLVATDGKQAIITYLDAINDLEKSKRIGTNALIIGKEFGDDITMLAGSVGVLENNWALLGETVNTTKDYFGSMDIEFKKISATTANKMVLIKNNIDGMLASIGDAFIPALNDLLLNMTPMVATIGEWAAANPELIQQITIIGGSLVATVVSLKLAVDGFKAAKATIDGLKIAYIALGSTMGLTVIGLGILLAAGALVYQNWDEIKQVVNDNQPAFIALGVSLTALTVALIAANAPLILLKVQAAATAVQAGIMTVATSAWSVAAGVAAAATWTFNAALAVLTSPILAIVAAIALIAAGGYLVVKNWGAISAGLKAEFDKISNAVRSAVNSMQAAWDNAVYRTRIAFANIGNSISTTLRALPGKMLTIGKQIVDGLVNGIRKGASSVVSAISNMASSAVAKAKSVLNIRSPSRVMKTVGEQTAEGMAVGIRKGTKAVVTEAQRMAAEAIKVVKIGIVGLQKELALFGNDSSLASLDWDIAAGKYKGAAQVDINELRRLTEIIELKKQMASANDSVQTSIDALIKKRVLFNNASESASLEYDILNTDRFQNASSERVQQLLDETRAADGLAKQLAATNLINNRFKQFGADQKTAADAFEGLDVNGPQTEAEKLRVAYDNKMAIVDKFEQMHTDKQAQAEKARLRLTEDFNQSTKDLEMQRQAANLGSITALFGMALGETSKGYKGMFLIQKAFDFASAQSASFTAIAKAWGSAPFPANIPAVATTTLQTGIIPAAIQALNPKGFMTGGYTGNHPTNMPVGPVHGKEFVTDAPTTRRFRPELEAMHNGTYERPTTTASNINVNVTVTSDGRSSVESDQQMGRNLGNVISAAVKQQIIKEKRQGGLLYV